MTRRTPQRGSAMLVTMIVISSLLAGAAVLVSMQLASSHSSDLARSGIASTYCAEAGLDAARGVVAANFANWPSALAACGSGPYPCAEPTWLSSALGAHDIDGDGSADFAVYIKDNDDEQDPLPNNLAVDNDMRVFVVSRCTKYVDSIKEVEELLQYSGGGQSYRSQQGLGRYGGGNNN